MIYKTKTKKTRQRKRHLDQFFRNRDLVTPLTIKYSWQIKKLKSWLTFREWSFTIVAMFSQQERHCHLLNFCWKLFPARVSHLASLILLEIPQYWIFCPVQFLFNLPIWVFLAFLVIYMLVIVKCPLWVGCNSEDENLFSRICRLTKTGNGGGHLHAWLFKLDRKSLHVR